MLNGTVFEEYITSIDGEVDERYLKRLLHVIEIAKIKYPYTNKRIKNYETHHIVPRSWGGSNDNNNLIHVPYKIHFLIHKLMTKSFPSDIKMLTAYWFMSNSKKGIIHYGNEYEKLRKEYQARQQSIFNGHVPVRDNNGEFLLIPREEYDSESTDYIHVTKGRKHTPERIKQWKDSFKNGERVSCRLGRVMAINVATNSKVLVDRDIFYKDSNYIGIGKNRIKSEAHRKAISDFMKTFPKTEVQRESARRLMTKLCDNDILCDCCGKYFNAGNYSHHLNGSPLKGTTRSSETVKACIDGIHESNKVKGTPRPITLIAIDGKEYISYNMDEACKKYGVSRPTFRKRVRPVKVGTHRNRNISYTTIDISQYKVYEDIIEDSHPHKQG